jgi:hypothetical protein
MTKFSTLLLALTTTIGLASASPLHPRDDVVDFNGPFNVTLINLCDDHCLAEHKHDWSISQILPNSGTNMTATTINDFPGEHGTGGDIYPVVGKIPFTSAADMGDVKENGHVFFVDRPATKSERQAIKGGGVDALDRNWRVSYFSDLLYKFPLAYAWYSVLFPSAKTSRGCTRRLK